MFAFINRRMLGVVCGLMVICFTPGFDSLFAQTTPAEALAAVRKAAAGRDIPGAKEALAAAAKVPGVDKEERERLDELVNYLEQFWRGVEQGAQTLQGLDELEVGATRVAIVEVLPGKIILRAAGQNRTYTPRDLPTKIALVIAERKLKPSIAQNKVMIGAFLALDAKGDQTLARQMWNDAIKAGVDVKHLLPELSIPPESPAVELPVLTTQQRAMLSPVHWACRVKGEKGWQKKTIELGQTDEGRLTITADESAETQLISKRTITGDFSCRVVLQDVPAGQKFGLCGPEAADNAFAIDVPAGTSVVEFKRQGNTLKATVGGRDVEVQTIGKPSARVAGHLFLSIPAKGKAGIAGFDFGSGK